MTVFLLDFCLFWLFLLFEISFLLCLGLFVCFFFKFSWLRDLIFLICIEFLVEMQHINLREDDQ